MTQLVTTAQSPARAVATQPVCPGAPRRRTGAYVAPAAQDDAAYVCPRNPGALTKAARA